MEKELPKLAAEFQYNGIRRSLRNVTIEEEFGTLIGMEVRKGGKFSHKIKRYKMDQIPILNLFYEDEA